VPREAQLRRDYGGSEYQNIGSLLFFRTWIDPVIARPRGTKAVGWNESLGYMRDIGVERDPFYARNATTSVFSDQSTNKIVPTTSMCRWIRNALPEVQLDRRSRRPLFPTTRYVPPEVEVGKILHGCYHLPKQNHVGLIHQIVGSFLHIWVGLRESSRHVVRHLA
jgi:hypothetical protein